MVIVGSIDIMTRMKGIDFIEAFDNVLPVQINDELTINVVHYKDLIKAKESAGRYKDLNDIEHLEKAINRDKG